MPVIDLKEYIAKKEAEEFEKRYGILPENGWSRGYILLSTMQSIFHNTWDLFVSDDGMPVYPSIEALCEDIVDPNPETKEVINDRVGMPCHMENLDNFVIHKVTILSKLKPCPYNKRYSYATALKLGLKQDQDKIEKAR